MKQVRITLTGVSPLLMHSIVGADRQNESVRELSVAVSEAKKKGADSDYWDPIIARMEYMVGLYLDDDGRIGYPSFNVAQSARDGAKQTKKGREVERGLAALKYWSDFTFDGPKTPEERIAARLYDRRMVGVSGKKVARVRPIFTGWKVSSIFVLNDKVLAPINLERYLETAGITEGIGDGRRIGFGRYTVTIE